MRTSSNKTRKKHQDCTHEPKVGPKEAENEAKMSQNGARSGPKRPQEELKKVKKANPNVKTKKEPNQDDPKTVLDPPRSD